MLFFVETCSYCEQQKQLAAFYKQGKCRKIKILIMVTTYLIYSIILPYIMDHDHLPEVMKLCKFYYV